MTIEDKSRRDFLKGSGVAIGAVGASGLFPEQADAQSTTSDKPANVTTSLTINGSPMRITHEARVSLLDLLREKLELTGSKKGCNEGACGACTVLLDGQRINACMTLAATCHERVVTTVEGLANDDGTLHAVQQAFIDQDAFQCGYCTPGQVVSAVACIQEGHAETEADIAEWMSGNICRCAGYPQIVAAVQQAAKTVGS